MQQYPELLLWNRRKTLTGSPDPTRANRPCTLMPVNDKEMSSTLQSIPLDKQNKLEEIHLKFKYCNVAIGCVSHPSTLLIGEPRLVHRKTGKEIVQSR